MTNPVSFQARTAQTVSHFASGFQSVFVDYEYLVCSEAFTNVPYYIVSANQDNYMHLTGIPFGDPQAFFDKCISGTLTEADIRLIRHGQTPNEVKGSIRRKITVLPNLINIFSVSLMAEESFSKNRVVCSFGTSDGICTVGFTITSKNSQTVKPMTLLKGSELDATKAKPVDLILKRKTGDLLFDSMIWGSNVELDAYRPQIESLLSDNLNTTIPR